MIETFTALESYRSETSKLTGDISKTIDTSKPLDFTIKKEIQHKEPSLTNQKEVDTSNSLDFFNSVDTKDSSELNLDKKLEKTSSNETEKNSYEIHTRNESLEGDRHPITGVPFERRTVQDNEGNDVTGVFPVFDSEYDSYLPENLYQSTDKEQFSDCNKQLKDAIENDPEFAKKFSSEQLEQIKNFDTPDGYTWHHNEETGKMQLVDSDIHAKTGHTGGKTIWGGGNENR